MKTSFLDYYRKNLTYLRELGGEFAAEFPKIAARLDLNEFECPDPYVERLLEGTAFLTARVEKKLDDGFPRLLEALLASAAPFTLCPEPSGAIVEVRPEVKNSPGASGTPLPRHTEFETFVRGIETPVCFSTVWDTSVSSLHVIEAEYLTRDFSRFAPGRTDCAAALRIRFSPGRLAGPLHLYLNLTEALGSELQRQLLTENIGVFAARGKAEFQAAPRVRCAIPVLDPRNRFGAHILPQMDGLRTCAVYFSHPEFYQFIELDGVPFSETGETELVFLFRKRVDDLRNAVRAASFRTNCVPVLNLFEKRSDRTELSDHFEYPVSPERTAPLDYEIFYIRALEFFDAGNRSILKASPFYTDRNELADGTPTVFFATHREKRIFERGKLRRSSYAGSDAFVSFSGEAFLEKISELRSFAADLVCTNRDLPMLLANDAVLTPRTKTGILSASFVRAPSRPQEPLIHSGRQDAWKCAGHLVFNLSSALAAPEKITCAVLREMLKLYSRRSPEETETIVSGITGIASEPSVFRFVRNGAVFFENGRELTITLDEGHFAGNGFFQFTEMLRQFLAGFTPLNSYLEIHINSMQRGKIGRWMTQKQN